MSYDNETLEQVEVVVETDTQRNDRILQELLNKANQVLNKIKERKSKTVK